MLSINFITLLTLLTRLTQLNYLTMSTYLITQATGQQAQWAITHLLKSGFKIHAVVRDPSKELPSILKHSDVTIFKGDSTDYDSIFKAAQGCTGVYLNTFPIPGVEAQQAKTICEASKNAGVQNVVACTTFFTGNKHLWDNEKTKEIGLYHYFNSKSEVEDIVRGAGFKTYTILRPAFIHFDYFKPSVYGNFPEIPTEATFYHMYDDEGRMPHTDGEDIGKYVAAAFKDPAKFGGAEIELGNEYLTIQEARDIVAKVSGKDVSLKRIPEEEKEAGVQAVFARRFHLWANANDFSIARAGVEATQKKYGIPFTPLEETFKKEKPRLLEALPN